MKTADVLVLQHTLEDGPGYLGAWLERERVAWEVRCTEAGDAFPDSLRGYRALAVLGGAWGANDDRPSLRQAEALIRAADAQGVPVIGHCLGGQLLARALGGRVERLPQPEIGWVPLQVATDPMAQAWLGPAGPAVVYHWHYDSFVTVPPGAQPLAASPACAHQAFACGPHLGMQFHIEITPAKIAAWLADPGTLYPQLAAQGLDSVQPPEVMNADTPRRLAASEAMADRIYARWRSLWRPDGAGA